MEITSIYGKKRIYKLKVKPEPRSKMTKSSGFLFLFVINIFNYIADLTIQKVT